MNINSTIIVISHQKLKNIKGATRAYNMFKAFENKGINVKYLDGWRPSFNFNIINLINIIRLLVYSVFYSKKKTYLFFEDQIPYEFLKIFKKINLYKIMDVRDDKILHNESMGISMSLKTKSYLELNQISNFEVADRILLTSESYKEYYSNKYEKEFDHKFIIVKNATDPNHFFPSDNNKKSIIGYLGGVNKDTGLDLFLEAALILKNQFPELEVHIGYETVSHTEKYIEQIKKNYNYDWVSFYNNVKYKEAPYFYSKLNVVVITRKESKINQISTPSKLFDSMACGKPVVVTNLLEQAKIVKETHCGLVCNFDPQDIAEKVKYLLINKDIAMEYGRNGRKTVESIHNWDHRVYQLLKEIREINND